MARKAKLAAAERKSREEAAIRLFRAKSDVEADPAWEFEHNYGKNTLFITGTIYDGRRLTEQIGFDERGPYLWSSGQWRYGADALRKDGRLVLGGIVSGSCSTGIVNPCTVAAVAVGFLLGRKRA